MEASSTYVSTRQAADLLGVHESSVKRWCNADDLACTFTPGGHRRILLGDLLAFAQARDFDTALLALEPFEEQAWLALDAARTNGTYDDLARLLYGWLETGDDHLPSRLCDLLLAHEITLGDLCDGVLAPALRSVGEAWAGGTAEVGDVHRMTQYVRDVLAYLRHTCIVGGPNPEGPPAVVGAVRGGGHDVGALMARLLLEGAGWYVVYLGPDVPTEAFAQQQQQHGAGLVVVALTPGHPPAEAWALARLLAQLYDPATPYRLAVGGGTPLAEAPPGTLADLPFLAVQDFATMAAFAAWLDGEAGEG